MRRFWISLLCMVALPAMAGSVSRTTCDALYDMDSYPAQNIVELAHRADLDDYNDVHQYMRDCSKRFNNRKYVRAFNRDSFKYRTLVDDVHVYRDATGQTEFDDTPIGGLIDILLK